MTVQEVSAKIRENIGSVIIGKNDVIDKVIVSLFCSGHILLEDIPGTGKTTLAKAVAKSIDCDFRRIQFTPDLLPSDVTGINYFNRKTEEFEFRKGAVFTNILLADEINRATPRTQSSLLECMEERQITVDGTTYKAEEPFLVIATQNPVETQGTFPLPEAQLDRFFMRLSLGYPEKEDELAVLGNFANANPLEEIGAVVTSEDVTEAVKKVREIKVSDDIRSYVLDIAEATRNDDRIRLGVSTRGAIALLRAAQGYAAVSGREYAIPDDVKAMTGAVLSHRIIIKGAHRKVSADEIISDILDRVAIPREEAV